MRDVVYTSVFGNYDKVSPIPRLWDNVTFYCFSDGSCEVGSGWKVIKPPLVGDPAVDNRRIKILAHEYLSEFDRSLYIDANLKIVSDPRWLFDKYLKNCLLALPLHSERTCVYEEGEACCREGLVDESVTRRQLARYAGEGLPKRFGLTENNIILRRHNEPRIITMDCMWWDEYLAGGRRDQLCLPYVLWKTGVPFTPIDEGPRYTNRIFVIRLHKKDFSKKPWETVTAWVGIRKERSVVFSMLFRVIQSILYLGKFMR